MRLLLFHISFRYSISFIFPVFCLTFSFSVIPCDFSVKIRQVDKWRAEKEGRKIKIEFLSSQSQSCEWRNRRRIASLVFRFADSRFPLSKSVQETLFIPSYKNVYAHELFWTVLLYLFRLMRTKVNRHSMHEWVNNWTNTQGGHDDKHAVRSSS